MELEYAERLADRPKWDATSQKALRGRRELPRSVPVAGALDDGEDRLRSKHSGKLADFSTNNRLVRSTSLRDRGSTRSIATSSPETSVEDLRSQLLGVLSRLDHLELQQMSQARARTRNAQANALLCNQTPESERCASAVHGSTAGRAEPEFPVTAEEGSEEKEEMIMVMDGIQDTIHRLERALSTTEHEAILRQEQIQAAATRLAAAARGYLQRIRYARAIQALRRWRGRQGSSIVRDKVNEYMRRRRKIVARMRELDVRRQEQTKESTLVAWHAYIISTRVERSRVLQAAEDLRRSIELNLLRVCMEAWLSLAVGTRSRKAVEAAYKERYAKAVAHMEASDAKRAIRRADVLKFLSDEASDYIIKRRAFHTKRICFKTWSEELCFDLNQLKKRADRFFLVRRFPGFFRAWQEYVHIRQSEAKVAYVWDPVRFDVEHNERVIENFARRLILRKYTQAWHFVTRQNRQIRDRQRAVLTREVAAVFAAWRTRARFQLQVKRICVDEWRDLSYRRRQLPFRAWYVYTKRARKVREAQAVLLSAFKRRKKRLLQSQFFRVWKHKAIFGKIGGLHTRGDLFKALDTQKKMLLAMEVNSDQQKEAIAELETALQNEKDRAENLQLNIADRKEELIRSKFAQQQLEEEVVRVQALFDAMSLIHPGTAKRLLQMRTKEDEACGVGAVARRAGEKSKMLSAGGPSSPSSSSNPGAAPSSPTAGSGSRGSSIGGGGGAVVAGASARSGPCVKCGHDPSQTCAEPLSARPRIESRGWQIPGDPDARSPEDEAENDDGEAGEGREPETGTSHDAETEAKPSRVDEDDDDDDLRDAPPPPLQRPTLEAAAVTWVTPHDADVILRTLWAQSKLKQLANKKQQQREDEQGPDAGEMEMEVRNLQSILAFVLSGDLHAVDLFQPDESAAERRKSLDRAALASTTSEMVGNLRKARIHNLANWNDFLQGLSKQFPLLHPANDNARLAVQRRIVSNKTQSQSKRLSIKPKGINMYAADA
ncbi:Hypothetical Protein FCC1311_031702 [Hondaea fermentalgiana]|uniref:Uncharacterized protein n=1 Tax=Hondaea fermentalgiana TaxID=2315210 RepID=A0A2R5G7C8_9STRA|nr:Hypothetical Protein FCC1311_031702 [Hondaea fermentalgiana]|eukprot:GBG26947.1 Hypothetical Protein FCC1311_031702 [Hondaea fermentalgiana]